MQSTKNGSETQIQTDENEKQKEKLAADHFFSSLLENPSLPPLICCKVAFVGRYAQCCVLFIMPQVESLFVIVLFPAAR